MSNCYVLYTKFENVTQLEDRDSYSPHTEKKILAEAAVNVLGQQKNNAQSNEQHFNPNNQSNSQHNDHSSARTTTAFEFSTISSAKDHNSAFMKQNGKTKNLDLGNIATPNTPVSRERMKTCVNLEEDLNSKQLN